MQLVKGDIIIHSNNKLAILGRQNTEENRGKGRQPMRLSWIELRLRFLGEVRRSDVIRQFQVNEITASRDLSEYRDTYPGNVTVGDDRKSYRRSESFIPRLNNFTASEVLETLTRGTFTERIDSARPGIEALLPPPLHEPDLNVLAALTEGIHRRQVVEIAYCSPSSGESSREIVPFVVAHDGLRWHVRAYDRKRAGYRDFVLTRIRRAQLRPSEAKPEEAPEHDLQWMRVVELQLVPKPSLKHPEAIALQYNMADGVLKLRLRAALAGYILRSMNVDCSPNASLSGPEYHLWLRNHLSLIDVANLGIAPGYVAPTGTGAT